MESEHLLADIPQKALIERAGQILLTRGKEIQWDLPGGRLHIGEDPIDGLRREIREELRLDIEPLDIIHTFVFTSKSVAHYVVIYRGNVRGSIEEMKVDESEIGGILWVGRDEFEDLPMRDGYKEALRKFFA